MRNQARVLFLTAIFSCFFPKIPLFSENQCNFYAPEDIRLRALLSDAALYFQRGKYLESKEVLQGTIKNHQDEILKSGINHPVLSLLAQCEYNLNNPNAALKSLDKLLESVDFEEWDDLEKDIYLTVKDIVCKKLSEKLQKTIELFNDDLFEMALKVATSLDLDLILEESKRISIERIIAISNYYLGEYKNSKAQLNEILTKNAKNSEVLAYLSMIYLEEENYEKALQSFEEVFSLDFNPFLKLKENIYLEKAMLISLLHGEEKSFLWLNECMSIASSEHKQAKALAMASFFQITNDYASYELLACRFEHLFSNEDKSWASFHIRQLISFGKLQLAIDFCNSLKTLPDEELYYLGWIYIYLYNNEISAESREEYRKKALDTFLTIKNNSLGLLGESWVSWYVFQKGDGMLNKNDVVKGLDASQFYLRNHRYEKNLLMTLLSHKKDKIDLLQKHNKLYHLYEFLYPEAKLAYGLEVYGKAKTLDKNTLSYKKLNEIGSNVLEHSYNLLSKDPVSALLALKMSCFADIKLATIDDSKKALDKLFILLNKVSNEKPERKSLVLLTANISYQLSKAMNHDSQLLEKAKTLFIEYIEKDLSNDEATLLAFNCLTSIYSESNDFDKAAELLEKMIALDDDYAISSPMLFSIASHFYSTDKSKSKFFLEHIYIDHKKSKMAPIAYLLDFLLFKGISSNEEDLSFLKSFHTNHQNKELSCFCSFLQGISYLEANFLPNNTALAIDSFSKVISSSLKTHSPLYNEIKVASSLTLSSLSGESPLELVEEITKHLLNYAENDSLLKVEFPFKNYYQTLLSQLYLHLGENQKAVCALEKIELQNTVLSHYFSFKRDLLKGNAYYNMFQYEYALESYCMAEQSLKKSSLGEPFLQNIWLEQAICLKSLTRYDSALMRLSRVINNTSLNLLKSKAMFLRAEVFETKGDQDIAFKQLKEISEGEGFWSNKAEEKMQKMLTFQK